MNDTHYKRKWSISNLFYYLSWCHILSIDTPLSAACCAVSLQSAFRHTYARCPTVVLLIVSCSYTLPYVSQHSPCTLVPTPDRTPSHCIISNMKKIVKYNSFLSKLTHQNSNLVHKLITAIVKLNFVSQKKSERRSTTVPSNALF